MYCVRSRLNPGVRSNDPADPWPGPPAIRNIVPRGVPLAGKTSTRRPIVHWLAHVSGATALAALEPHQRRVSLHPLQRFTRARGPEQLDGAWAALTAESAEAREIGVWLAETMGLRPFPLADAARPLYHAGAAIASNYLVTLHAVASDLLRAAGAPPEALVPLMRRTIENGFELTGPIERGDWETVEAHRRAIRGAAPELEPLYDVLADATAR